MSLYSETQFFSPAKNNMIDQYWLYRNAFLWKEEAVEMDREGNCVRNSAKNKLFQGGCISVVSLRHCNIWYKYTKF
jgi:hypothetical protein